jgi:cytochrome d ubiquinol oxidase subunit I
MLMASMLTVAFLLAGMSAWRWLRGDRAPSVMAVLRTGVVMAAVGAPTQLLLGDMHGLNTLEHQPAKVAAMEGNWETRGHVPLLLFAIPDEAARENRFEIGIPSGASLILRHSAAGEVPGLNDFRGEHPPVAPVFYAFRVMVGTGMLMIAFGLGGAFLLWRRGALPRIILWGFVAMTFSGWVATLAGWYVTEIGRQPWLVTGVLTTAQAAGPVPAASIGATLAMYLTLYALLLVAYVGTLYRLAARGRMAPDAAPALKGAPA